MLRLFTPQCTENKIISVATPQNKRFASSPLLSCITPTKVSFCILSYHSGQSKLTGWKINLLFHKKQSRGGGAAWLASSSQGPRSSRSAWRNRTSLSKKQALNPDKGMFRKIPLHPAWPLESLKEPFPEGTHQAFPFCLGLGPLTTVNQLQAMRKALSLLAETNQDLSLFYEEERYPSVASQQQQARGPGGHSATPAANLYGRALNPVRKEQSTEFKTASYQVRVQWIPRWHGTCALHTCTYVGIKINSRWKNPMKIELF